MDLKLKVSLRVKSKRLELGLTQRQLAARSKLNVRYISRLENSPQNITLDILDRVASALGCSVVDLVLESSHQTTSRKNLQTLDDAIRLLTAFRSELKPDR